MDLLWTAPHQVMITDLVRGGVLVATCNPPKMKFFRILAEEIVYFKIIKPPG